MNPREFRRMIDQLDLVSLESTPEAAIAWIVEQFMLLGHEGYSWETAIIIIADYRNEGLGLSIEPLISGKNTTDKLVTFVKSRVDNEFPTPEPSGHSFFCWAVGQCTFYCNKL